MQEIRQTAERASTMGAEKAPHPHAQDVAPAIRSEPLIISMRLQPMGSMTLGALRRRTYALLEIFPHVGFDRVFDADHFLHGLKVSPNEEKKEAKKRRTSPTARGEVAL